jgi:hypothetical protein
MSILIVSHEVNIIQLLILGVKNHFNALAIIQNPLLNFESNPYGTNNERLKIHKPKVIILSYFRITYENNSLLYHVNCDIRVWCMFMQL